MKITGIKRKLLRLTITLLVITGLLMVTVGTFKYFEKKTIEKAQMHLAHQEPYQALLVFENWETLLVHRLVSDFGLMDPLWHYHWGLAALRTGNYQKAYAQFKRVSEGPVDSNLKSLAYFNQGEARLWQWDAGAFEDASALYIEALKLNPEMILAKKRLEWLRQANLVKTQKEMKAKGKERGSPHKDGNNNDEKDQNEQSEKFKSTQGKQRRGY